MHHEIVSLAETSFKMALTICQNVEHVKRLFVKKLKILYSSDHPILIKFHHLVANIVIKELQMVFLTSTVINSNGNMKELERKIKCEKLMFR